jgi:hypothetical protein
MSKIKCPILCADDINLTYWTNIPVKDMLSKTEE